MSSDGINRITLLRNLYQARELSSSSESIRELQQIKNEIRIANDESVRNEQEINCATNSPYLTDQIFFNKKTIYNSPEETKWKEVKSSDQVQKDIEASLVENNRKKLNII